MRTTNRPRVNAAAGSWLPHWSLGIGAVAFLTMFFNPLSILGAAAVIPGTKAIRAGTRSRGVTILGMVLGVLATALVASYFISGGQQG